ncbi:MAG: hypothetical protein KDC83_13050 [Flavobacteriales bacterium]|nr:hypothetical protein [Flavobacteriales bacterium]MCB0538015.1 hypothetical protein [Bacteroidota bacterium]
MAEESMTYFEDLDVGITCPHEDAFAPDGKKVFYRYIHRDVVKSESFLPTKPNPAKPLPPYHDACIEKAVSLFDHIDGLINGVFKLPHHKGKKRIIGLITLTPTDGLVKQTGHPNHHSWWRSQQFDHAVVQTQEIVIE